MVIEKSFVCVTNLLKKSHMASVSIFGLFSRNKKLFDEFVKISFESSSFCFDGGRREEKENINISADASDSLEVS